MDEILQSTSDVLFPAEMGEKRVEIASRGTEGDTALHVMVWRDDVLGVIALIEAGAEIDAIGDMGQTPLHVAVMKQNEHIAEVLLNLGANPDVRSEFGDTAGELAISQGGPMKRLFSGAVHQTAARERVTKRGA